MSETPAITLKAQLRDDLKVAMLARRSEDAGTLRTLIAAIDNAEAPTLVGGRTVQLDRASSAETARLDLGWDDLRAILAAQVAERKAAVSLLREKGAGDRVEKLLAEIDLIERYRE